MTSTYQLQQIQVDYQGRRVLDIPQLNIEIGSSVALLGENGAGKSTLLNLLAFIAKADNGIINLFGQTINAKLPRNLRRRIGYVSQQPYLLSGSVKDNIKLALKLQDIPHSHHEKLIEQALEQTNLLDFADQATSTLSGGELKRTAIARAIVYQPDILLLDEPFSHLDRRSKEQLEIAIQSFTEQSDKTVVFSTHDQLQGLSLASQTINLVNGTISRAPLLNLFHGQLVQHNFDTGNLIIHVTSQLVHARHITIDPTEIIISRQPLASSTRNHFSGPVTLIAAETDTVRLIIDCGESFQAIISRESHAELDIQFGDDVWLSFKASAVNVF